MGFGYGYFKRFYYLLLQFLPRFNRILRLSLNIDTSNYYARLKCL